MARWGRTKHIIPGELEDINWIKRFPFVIIYIYIYIFLAHRPVSIHTPYTVYICCVGVCPIMMSIASVSAAEF